jgi:hypothetical protein
MPKPDNRIALRHPNPTAVSLAEVRGHATPSAAFGTFGHDHKTAAVIARIDFMQGSI